MIRKAKVSDIPDIFNLIKIGCRCGQVLSRSEEEIGVSIDNFFVYVENKEVIGCCALDIYNKKLAEIRSLVVLPEYQNNGIGSSLIKKAVEKAKKKEIYQILAVTDHHKLFKINGFRSKLNKKTPMFVNLK